MHPAMHPAEGQPAPSNRRRHGRVRCADIRCSLGEVLDLSGSGIRVRSRARPAQGTPIDLTIHALDGPVTVRCVPRQEARHGPSAWDIGLEFTELTPHVRRALVELARASAYNEVLSR